MMTKILNYAVKITLWRSERCALRLYNERKYKNHLCCCFFVHYFSSILSYFFCFMYEYALCLCCMYKMLLLNFDFLNLIHTYCFRIYIYIFLGFKFGKYTRILMRQLLFSLAVTVAVAVADGGMMLYVQFEII